MSHQTFRVVSLADILSARDSDARDKDVMMRQRETLMREKIIVPQRTHKAKRCLIKANLQRHRIESRPEFLDERMHHVALIMTLENLIQWYQRNTRHADIIVTTNTR